MKNAMFTTLVEDNKVEINGLSILYADHMRKRVKFVIQIMIVLPSIFVHLIPISTLNYRLKSVYLSILKMMDSLSVGNHIYIRLVNLNQSQNLYYTMESKLF
jgi:hypothetical protein